ncbi:uncharacterized protein LOC131889540 [Tigriopus californicus]|uniref:uncharacterized protein LOC131889540 n=1 Tax=Tigriopus californicus TaxID=6832 RepID=UPI0027D9F5EC|nr:uncharacterized protein LOC131889540 [Tigriopus californicus]
MGQDYEVIDIDCSLGENSVSQEQFLHAVLRKPEKFKGVPLFADDRKKDPLTDPECSIVPDPLDPQGLTYNLRISDLNECGVILKDEFISVRVWFPRLSGVVMMSDQEVIIMCKPPQPTITLNKAAEYASQIDLLRPPTARVSGVVQESPGNLEYEVALFRETDPDNQDFISNEVPVDQAVPIGTKLQLRASINTNSSWKYVKLLEVTLSPSSEDAFAGGHITLIESGCRKEEFYSIIPRQPYHPSQELKGEVRLEFEAVLLDVQGEAKRINQLWIHARIKACITQKDCEPANFGVGQTNILQPTQNSATKGCRPSRRPTGLVISVGKGESHVTIWIVMLRCLKVMIMVTKVKGVEFCLDVFQPSGAGRKKRDLVTKDGVTTLLDVEGPTGEAVLVRNPEELVKRESSRQRFFEPAKKRNSGSKSASIGDNVGVTIILPDDYYKELKGGQKSDKTSPSGSSLSSVEKTLDCNSFIIVGVSLACSLIVASLLLFYLSLRLYKVSKLYKRQKLDEVVREHRRKYGVQQQQQQQQQQQTRLSSHSESTGLSVHHMT